MANSAMTVTGSGGGGGGTQLDVINISSPMSELDFNDMTSDYKLYEIRLYNILSTAQGNNLYARTSTDNGVSFDSGAGEYEYGNLIGLGGSQYNPHSISATSISLTATETGYGLSQVAGNTLQGRIWIWNPSAVNYCQISSLLTMQAYFGGNTLFSNINGGGFRKAAAAVNAIRLFVNASTLASGSAELWGYP